MRTRDHAGRTLFAQTTIELACSAERSNLLIGTLRTRLARLQDIRGNLRGKLAFTVTVASIRTQTVAVVALFTVIELSIAAEVYAPLIDAKVADTLVRRAAPRALTVAAKTRSAFAILGASGLNVEQTIRRTRSSDAVEPSLVARFPGLQLPVSAQIHARAIDAGPTGTLEVARAEVALAVQAVIRPAVVILETLLSNFQLAIAGAFAVLATGAVALFSGVHPAVPAKIDAGAMDTLLMETAKLVDGRSAGNTLTVLTDPAVAVFRLRTRLAVRSPAAARARIAVDGVPVVALFAAFFDCVAANGLGGRRNACDTNVARGVRHAQ